MGGLLLKNGGFPPFFVLFLVCDGRFGVFFVVVCVEWGCGGVLLWLVVSFLCDVVRAGGFLVNRVSLCSWRWALGSSCLWWCGARSGVGGGAILSW